MQWSGGPEEQEMEFSNSETAEHVLEISHFRTIDPLPHSPDSVKETATSVPIGRVPESGKPVQLRSQGWEHLEH